MPDQQQAPADELSAVTSSAHSAPEPSKFLSGKLSGKSSMSKSSVWSRSAWQGSAQSASTSAHNSRKLSEGIFDQPLVQPTSSFLTAHMAKYPELCGSPDVDSPSIDLKDMAEEIRQQQQQSFRQLLERQDLRKHVADVNTQFEHLQ